jgi:hypothetical protein
MVFAHGPDVLPNVALVMMDGATNFPLIAIPLFILAGAIMNSTGISRRLIAFASALFGFVKGGLAMVNIGTSLFFAEISGSAVADVAALYLLVGDPGGDYSTVDPDDFIRGNGAKLGRAIVCCRHCPRRSGRFPDDVRSLPVCSTLQLSRRRGV